MHAGSRYRLPSRRLAGCVRKSVPAPPSAVEETEPEGSRRANDPPESGQCGWPAQGRPPEDSFRHCHTFHRASPAAPPKLSIECSESDPGRPPTPTNQPRNPRPADKLTRPDSIDGDCGKSTRSLPEIPTRQPPWHRRPEKRRDRPPCAAATFPPPTRDLDRVAEWHSRNATGCPIDEKESIAAVGP